MFSAILILLLLPITDVSRSRGMQFRPLSKIAFYVFIANFLILMQLGAKHVESPFIEFGQISTILYFLYFTVIMYSITYIENSFVELNIWRANNIKIMHVSEGIELVRAFENKFINYIYNMQAPIGPRMRLLALIKDSSDKARLKECVMSLAYDSNIIKVKLIKELILLRDKGHITEFQYMNILEDINYTQNSVEMQLYKKYGYNKDKYDKIRS